MKKFTLILVILFFCSVFPAYAQNFKGKPKPVFNIEPPEKNLRVGEVLNFSVEWLGIPVGNVVLKIEGIETIDNRKYYHITGTAKPNSFFQTFVNLEYWVDSYFDVETHVSRRFEKNRRLNAKANHVLIDFDPNKNEAVFNSVGAAETYPISEQRSSIETANPDTNKIPKNTQDLLSCLYYFRLLDLKEGESYAVNIYYSRKNWLLNFNVGKPFRKDIHNKGSFILFKVASFSALNDLIFGKSKFYAYFTADSRRIPVEFSFNTGIGLVTARIQEFPK